MKAKPAAVVPPDEKAIEGTWKIVTSSLELCRFPRGRMARGPRCRRYVYRTTRIIITGDTLKVLGDEVVGEAFQYKLNPAASPRMIDLLSGGRAALGIYELQGNRLRICTDEAPGRPKEFWADSLAPSKDLLVLERVGDAAVEPDEKTIQGTWEVLDCSTRDGRMELFGSRHGRRVRLPQRPDLDDHATHAGARGPETSRQLRPRRSAWRHERLAASAAAAVAGRRRRLRWRLWRIHRRHGAHESVDHQHDEFRQAVGICPQSGHQPQINRPGFVVWTAPVRNYHLAGDN